MIPPKNHLPGKDYYEFRLKGILKPDWSDWLGGLTITSLENGDTLLSGPLPDQAALHGVLTKIRDLNLVLLSVNHIQQDS